MSILIKVFCCFKIFSIIWRRRYIHVNNNILKCASLTLMDSNCSSGYQWKLSSNTSTITYSCFSVLCKYGCPCIINSVTIIVSVFLMVKLSNLFILTEPRVYMVYFHFYCFCNQCFIVHTAPLISPSTVDKLQDTM